MKRYVILTNRKRTIIALVHTVVFLAVAAVGLVTVVQPLHSSSGAGAWILAAVYAIVSSILLVLTAIAGNLWERSYFGFCTTSAGFGLLRQILGDPRMHVAVYIRVSMLSCAVLTGFSILRSYRQVLAESE